MRLTPFAIALALALAPLAALPARAEDEIWVWTTADGAVHYTDERERVPDEFRASARVAHKEGAGSYQRVGAPAAAAGGAASAKSAAAPAAAPGDPDAAAESVWRAEAQEIHARIAALSEQVAACAGDHVNLSPGDGSRKRREEHEEAERCARARADLALASADREALEERARRESIPPGWIRADD